MTGNKLVEYIKLHRLSLEQDQAKLTEQMSEFDEDSKDFVELDFEYNYLSGQINALGHILYMAGELE